MRGARSLCMAAAALAMACAHAPPPLHTTRLVVTSDKGGFLPFVRAKVAGEELMLLVDTGATKSMLPARFALKHGLRRGRDSTIELLMDSNGRLEPMPLLLDVPVQFEGESAAGTMDFLMNVSDVEIPILAPQDLVRRGWAIVIDLGREELTYEPEDLALKRVGGDGRPLQEVKFSRCLQEGLFSGPHRIVATTINGVPSKMLIDTGAQISALARNNPALPSMASMLGQRGTTLGVASKGHGIVVDGVRISFFNTSFVVPATVSPASNPCFDGAIGADVLRHCTLVWGQRSLWAGCRAPADGK